MTLRLHVVGGLGAFGQNCLLVEEMETGDAVCIDAGAGFPREGPAQELMVADPNFLKPFVGRLRAYVCTHGHEDHIGALGYFHKVCPAPVYGAPTTLALIRHRCQDKGMPTPELEVLLPGQDIQLGAFHLGAMAVSHSIPDTLCLVVEGGGVTLVHSGDFRVDLDPVDGPPTDMSGLSSLANKNVDLLLADSTGAVTHGHNPGERSVVPHLTAALESSPRRVFVATFASHIQRLGMLGTLAHRFGRKVMIAGRGAINHSRIAVGLGRLPFLDGISVHASEAPHLPPEKLLVVMSGCQGEDYSAFWRLAHGDGRLPPVEAHDTVIHSARAVPGNEGKVAALLDACARKGARILEGRDGVHVSGHGYQEDMRALIQAVKPRAVMAIHGGFRHLHALSDLAQEEGLDPDMAPVFQSGDVVEVAPHAPPRVVDHAPVENMLVDDDGNLFPATRVLLQRKDLCGGVVLVSALVDRQTGELLGNPSLSLRGIGGALEELLRLEGAHEAAVSLNALPLEERLDPETAQQAMMRGVRRVLRRADHGVPVVVAHAHVV
jgi:ribonuclease J